MSVADHGTFLKRLKNQGYQFDVIYDVGANIGAWSCEVQEIFPNSKFELFEPLVGKNEDLDSLSRFSELAKHQLHVVALSDENEEGKIKVLGNKGVGSSILILEADYRKETTWRNISIVKMDSYVEKNDLSLPDFIKLDTQAAELKVLKGAINCLEKCQFVLLETWLRRVYGPETPLFHETANFLYENNYCLYEILSTEEGRDPDGTLRWFDAVFINKAYSKKPNHLL